jgi:hypothetical protein
MLVMRPHFSTSSMLQNILRPLEYDNNSQVLPGKRRGIFTILAGKHCNKLPVRTRIVTFIFIIKASANEAPCLLPA